jgi:3-dehydroquinate dehydratase-1
MIREAKRADMPVVMSWHSFGRVMGVREIIDVIENMQAMDADILKVATIVEHPKEAALVMYAAAEAQEEFPDNPVIVIGMGKDGVLTRTAGNFLGAPLTFASGKKPSAPGQISAADMDKVLDIFYGKYGK